MKALRKMNPKNIVKKKHKHHDQDGESEEDESGQSQEMDMNNLSTSSQSLGAAYSNMPQGFKMMAGPPPPGAKMMTGPPPPGAKMMARPPPGTPIHISSRPNSPSPPQGYGPKGMPMNIPPGAKMMSGPPPQGAKLMMSRPLSPNAMNQMPAGIPPGAKMLSGPPPPGAMMMKGPPPMMNMGSPPRAASPPLRPGSGNVSPSNMALPPGAKLMSGPPPQGVKIMKGPPPPGMIMKSPSRSMSPTLENSLNFTPVPGSPPAGAVLTKGVKIPPGAKMILKSPPRSMSPNTKMMAPAVAKSPPNGIIPNFTTSPPNTDLMKPAPIRPAAPGPTVKKMASPVATKQYSSDFEFEEVPPAGEEGKQKTTSPPANIPPEAAVREESEDSTMFHEEPDAATAAPPAGSNAAPSSLQKDGSMTSSLHSVPVKNEVKSNTTKTASAKDSRHMSRQDSRGDVDQREEKKKRRKHRSKKKSRKHRKHHSRDDDDESDESSSSSSRSSRDAIRTPSSSRPPPTVGDHTNMRKDSFTRDTNNDRFEREGEGEDSLFSEAALVPMALTTKLRSKIAEEFLSILCPQQYYGRVRKINGIRPIRSDRSKAAGLRKNNSIYVATKGSVPNAYFYPQLRLEENDGHPATDEVEMGALDTPIILYEAAPGIMLFAESELEAKRLLMESENATSCFVLDCSALLFKDPENYVLPVAMLNVRWVPYSTPMSEPQCPIHKKELQLFDPYSKELVCALCANNNNSQNKSKLVVIPDVLSGDSRRRIQESVSRQLDEAQRNAKLWLGQHQRIAKVADDRKEAINQQFNFLLNIIEGKRRQFLENCDVEFSLALTDAGKEILLSDEKVQLLSAASDHLRIEITRPLYSMQIATIAEALEATDKYNNNFDRNNLQVPVSSQNLPNLESVITEVQRISPYPGTTAKKGNNKTKHIGNSYENGRGTSRSVNGKHIRNSPFHETSSEMIVRDDRSPYTHPNRRLQERAAKDSRERNVTKGDRTRRDDGHEAEYNGNEEDHTDGDDVPVSHRQESHGRHTQNAARRRSVTPPQRQSRNLLEISPSRAAPQTPSVTSPRKQMKTLSRAAAKNLYATNTLSVPNSTGTSLFDYALNELIDDADNSTFRSQRQIVVEWRFRVEDPGDWVGIGVGVGSTIDAWEKGTRNDLSHLWIVPYSPSKQTYLLRVTVNQQTGHAKLSIHDNRGRHLDDGNIPQWNGSRISYPQVTFGGKIGKVRLIEIPHLV